MTDLTLYSSELGQTRLYLCAKGQSVWLNQLAIAERFQTTKQSVSRHAKNIFNDGGLSHESSLKDSLTVQAEGQRQVAHCSLNLVHADLDDPKEIEQFEHTLKNTGKKP
ncbi:UNVERIFIED_ORG: hypothetical protein J2W16_002094 [Pseudomonas cremoricolorata]|nr:hypothetical protein [Pseudomonas cremoricolorata]